MLNAPESSGDLSSSNSPTNYRDLAAIVIDTGTGYTKSGFSGDEKPRSVLKTTVGVPMVTITDVLYYIGDNIPKHNTSVEKRKVMTYGIVTDWEALEMLWHHIFYLELNICPEELAVLVTDVPMSPLTNREKTAELLFENFGVPAMYISHQSLLSLYSCGRVSGLVVESGHGTSYTTPIDDGYVLPHATYRLDLAGEVLTNYLAKLMGECGNPFYEDEMDLVCDIKEKCCYVTSEYDTEIQGNEKNYLMDFTLPDGHVISIGSERFRCPESIFNPTVFGLTDGGLHVQAMTSVHKCEPEQQANLLANVVVCGGSSLFHGFSERIKKELSKQANGMFTVNVLASQHRKFSAWLGGSVTASLDSFQNLWIDRALYNEKGSSVVHRYCF